MEIVVVVVTENPLLVVVDEAVVAKMGLSADGLAHIVGSAVMEVFIVAKFGKELLRAVVLVAELTTLSLSSRKFLRSAKVEVVPPRISQYS